MTIALAKKIQEYINSYKSIVNDIIEDMNENLAPFKNSEVCKRYTDEGLKQTIVEIIKDSHDNIEKFGVVFNQKLTATITAAKKDTLALVMSNDSKKGADYQMKISNALQFLAAEGADITDESAFDILGDFVGDVKQMRLFRNVITNSGVQIINANGENKFPLTFGILNTAESINNTFTELEALAKMEFVNSAHSTVETFGGNRFEVPTPYPISDKFEFNSADEQSMVSFASIIDSLAESVA